MTAADETKFALLRAERIIEEVRVDNKTALEIGDETLAALNGVIEKLNDSYALAQQQMSNLLPAIDLVGSIVAHSQNAEVQKAWGMLQQAYEYLERYSNALMYRIKETEDNIRLIKKILDDELDPSGMSMQVAMLDLEAYRLRL